MSVKVKIGGKIKEYQSLQLAINDILRHKDEVEFLRGHREGD